MFRYQAPRSVLFLHNYLFSFFVLIIFSRETKVARNLLYNHNATLIKLIERFLSHTTGRNSCSFNDVFFLNETSKMNDF